MNIVAMARVESEILEAGFKAPDFTLPEPLTGKSVNLYDYTKDAKATLIMIICNHWWGLKGWIYKQKSAIMSSIQIVDIAARSDYHS